MRVLVFWLNAVTLRKYVDILRMQQAVVYHFVPVVALKACLLLKVRRDRYAIRLPTVESAL
jgi:hypothetical protein